MNIKRKYSAGYKNMDITKKRRKIIRGNKKRRVNNFLMLKGYLMNLVALIDCFIFIISGFYAL